MVHRILGLASAHFLVAAAVSFLAYGSDLDQLRSRSALSRVAGVLHDVLWYPHDVFLRALPPGSVARPGVVPAVLLGSSLFWGILLYALCRGIRTLHQARRPPTGTPRA